MYSLRIMKEELQKILYYVYCMADNRDLQEVNGSVNHYTKCGWRFGRWN